MKALRFDGSLKLWTDAPTPRREGEALVEVICAGICNTDLEIARGYAGFTGTPGHEFVGRVVESPVSSMIGRRVVGEINAGCGNCDLCLAGDCRHCAARTVLGIKGRDGAFAEFLSLPARNLIEVPDSVSDDEAVFVEPLAAAFNILEQVEITPSTEVALVGDGKLAQLIARVVAATGSAATVIGKHDEKLALMACYCARRLKLEEGRPQAAEKFDVVIEASGSGAGLALALALVKPRGNVVLKTTHHGATRLDMSQVVVNEVKIIGSRCGRFLPALELLASGRIDVRPLISARLPIDEGLLAFERAAHPGAMKMILRMS
jgi:2-desacetyl-2-hydroxyethyl bacteriochlorophyllide A dehydrogenase